jgi:hypothetical protein
MRGVPGLSGASTRFGRESQLLMVAERCRMSHRYIDAALVWYYGACCKIAISGQI